MIKIPPPLQSALSSSYRINNFRRAVEELVYNALDANATSIAVRVDLENNSIQVIDNGCGIKESDFDLLGQRYTTSKFDNIAALNTIPKTYGFRGLSLASLIEVSSELKIVSRFQDTETTFSKTFYKGRGEVSEVSLRPSKGTTVEIRGFLYNLRIQRRALDNSNELLAIKALLKQLSLLHDNVSLSLRDDSKNEIIFKIHKNRDIFQTISNLFNINSEDLQEITVEKNQYKVRAFIAKKEIDLQKYHWIYLNGKFIPKGGLHKIINKKFSKSSYLRISKLKQKQELQEENCDRKNIPTYFLFISCPYKDYDININERKTNVEFKVWDQIKKILEKLVQCYSGDIRLKEITNTKSVTNINKNVNTREEIRRIMDKILTKNSKKEKNLQIFNGVVGKKIKRKERSREIKNGKLRTNAKSGNKTTSSLSLSKINEPKNILNSQTKNKSSKHCEINCHKNKSTNYNRNNQKILQQEKTKYLSDERKIVKDCPKQTSSKNKFDKGRKYNEKFNKLRTKHKNNMEFKNSINSDINLRGRVDTYENSFGNDNDNRKFRDKYITLKHRKTFVTTYDLLQTVLDLNCTRNTTTFQKHHKINVLEETISSKLFQSKLTYDSHRYGVFKNKHKLKANNVSVKKFISKDSRENLLSVQKNNKSRSTKKRSHKETFNKPTIFKRINFCEESLYSIHDTSNAFTNNDNYLSNDFNSKSINELFEPVNNVHDLHLRSMESAFQRENVRYINHSNVTACDYFMSNKLSGGNFDNELNVSQESEIDAVHTKVKNQINETNIYSVNSQTSDKCFYEYNKLNSVEFQSTDPKRKDNMTTFSQYDCVNETHKLYNNTKYYTIYSKSSDLFNRCDNTFNYSMCNYIDPRKRSIAPSCETNEYCQSLHDTDIQNNDQYSKSCLTSFNEYNTIVETVLEHSKMDLLSPVQYSSDFNNQNFRYFSPNYYNKHKEIYELDKSHTVNTSLLNNETKSDNIAQTYTVHKISDTNTDSGLLNKSLTFNKLSPDDIEKFLDFNNYGLTYNKDIDTKDSDMAKASDQNTNLEVVNPIDVCEAVIKSQSLLEERNVNVNINLGDNNTILSPKETVIEEQDLESNKIISSHHFNTNEVNELFLDSFHNTTKSIDLLGKKNPETITQLNEFDIKSRLTFVPKGMSPIFKNCIQKPGDTDTVNLNAEYYKDVVYNNFAEEIVETVQVFEPKIQNLNDAGMLGIKRIDDKIKKNNADLIFDIESIKNAEVLDQVDCKFIVTILHGITVTNQTYSNFLVLFDQHAVSERIRLENNLADYFNGDVWKSINIDEISFKVSKDDLIVLHNHKEKISRFGLQWNIDNNNNNISVYGIPKAILGKNPRQVDVVLKATRNLLRELIDALKSLKGNIPLYPQAIMDLIFSEACRYAIMFGDKLSKNECITLLESLGDCKTPFQCAHGRPVMAVIMEIKETQHDFKIDGSKVKQFVNSKMHGKN